MLSEELDRVKQMTHLFQSEAIWKEEEKHRIKKRLERKIHKLRQWTSQNDSFLKTLSEETTFARNYIVGMENDTQSIIKWLHEGVYHNA